VSWPPKIGELLPRAAEAVGVHRKLATYSLAVGHRRGGPKAVLFERLLGITLEHVDHLAEEIRAGVLAAPIISVRDNAPHGVNCHVRIPVRGVGIHQARVIAITTGWQLRYVGDRPRLVSAYIKKR
jgi:uncharacterized protein DUF6883